MLNDYGKLILLLTCAVGGFVMAIVGMVTRDHAATTSGVGIVMAVVGYATGNGVLARSGKAPSPVIVPSPERIAQQHPEPEAVEQ